MESESIKPVTVNSKKASRERLDVMLVNRGLVESREKGKAIIMAGEVFVDGQREDKAGSMFKPDVHIEIKGKKMKYVSRAGYKLEKAVDVFGVGLEGLTCMDVGASTGGFTDCMLQNGAVRIYAVDVGTNQLDWRLRSDPRVVSMENTNMRYVTTDTIGEQVDFVSIDVSFISVTKLLGAIKPIMKDNAHIVCLIKPQFEAGREQVGKGGIVRDERVHSQVITAIGEYFAKSGFELLGLDFSPIKGTEGNIEYLLYARNDASVVYSEDEAADNEAGMPYEGFKAEEVEKTVKTAHEGDSVKKSIY